MNGIRSYLDLRQIFEFWELYPCIMRYLGDWTED